MLRKTRVEIAPMTVRAASARRTNSGILSTDVCRGACPVLVAVDRIEEWAWSILPILGAPGLHDALLPKSNDTLRLTFLGAEGRNHSVPQPSPG